MMFDKFRFFSILLFLAFLLLCSCEQETVIVFYIENQSDDIIFVSRVEEFRSPYDTAIATGNRGVLFHSSPFGIQTERPLPSFYFEEGINVINSQGDTLTKDYTNIANWEWISEEHKWWVAHEQTMTVTDNDF